MRAWMMSDEGLKRKELSLGWEVSWMIPDDSPGTCYPTLGSCPGQHPELNQLSTKYGDVGDSSKRIYKVTVLLQQRRLNRNSEPWKQLTCARSQSPWDRGVKWYLMQDISNSSIDPLFNTTGFSIACLVMFIDHLVPYNYVKLGQSYQPQFKNLERKI